MTFCQRHVLALGMLAGLATAQTPSSGDASPDGRVWAAFAYINHGEKTPALSGSSEILTPLGSRQMLNQGAAFRSRYLADDSAVSSSHVDAIGAAPIANLDFHVLNNNHLVIQTQSDEWATAGALAFFQGLYPPTNETVESDASRTGMARDWRTDSTTMEYPLGGYQCPNLVTSSKADVSSAFIQGTAMCSRWVDEMDENFENRQDLVDLAKSTAGYYQDLFTSAPLRGTISLDSVNFWHASEIYDFVQYMYIHNETVHDDLESPNETLDTLRAHATELERAKSSEIDSADKDDPINILYTIAGRTLAREIGQRLTNSVASGNVDNKLSLVFGSMRPLLAFFSISGLLTRENLMSGAFGYLPEPGAAMVFEVVSEDDTLDADVQLPPPDELSIRFWYRASANESAPFERYSLFNSGFGGASIPFTAFTSEMEDIGRTPAEWCSICKPGEGVPWCAAYKTSPGSTSTPSSSSYGIHPALAGLIGAAILAAVLVVTGLALYTLAGLRLRRNPSNPSAVGITGAFRREEKFTHDADLAVTKSGAQQERVGSWELRGGEEAESASRADFAAPAGVVSLVTPSRRRGSHEGDAVSILNSGPVSVRECI